MQLNGVVVQDLAESYQLCFQLPKEARLAVRGLWLLDGALKSAHLPMEEDREYVRDMGKVRRAVNSQCCVLSPIHIHLLCLHTVACLSSSPAQVTLTVIPAQSLSPSHQHSHPHCHTSTVTLTLTPAQSLSLSHQHSHPHQHTNTSHPHPHTSTSHPHHHTSTVTLSLSLLTPVSPCEATPTPLPPLILFYYRKLCPV